jgi:phosphoglycerate dehydrogenase-like enzyme
MLILAALRRFDQRARIVKAGGWNDGLAGSLTTFELEGKTVGVVGMGNIGTAVVTRLRGFGVKVVYFSVPRLSVKEESKLDLHYMSLEGVLDECDVLTLHVPLTPQTRQLIGHAELGRMKRGAVLVNTARGALVEEKALVSALARGDLFYAAVDTLSEEPPPPGSDLRGVDNLLITPHVAGHTRESWSKSFGNAALNVGRVMSGKPPLWPLRDKEGGVNNTT